MIDSPSRALVFTLAVLARNDLEAGLYDRAFSHDAVRERITAAVSDVLLEVQAQAYQTTAPRRVDVVWLDPDDPILGGE